MKQMLANAIKDFIDIFSFRNEEAKGRVITLTSTLLTTVYNVFITGIFYTGFLTMYGMTITDTGVLMFVPFLANLFSVFSPAILSHFKRRKLILCSAKVVYYAIYVVLITVMPQFVTDPQARMTWFVALSFIATAFYALFSSGFTTWFYNFYPADHEKRSRFLMLMPIFSMILSAIVLIGSGWLTDALSNSPYQDQLILFFRYFAFALAVVDVICQSRAKEYPYVETEQVTLTGVFTLPFQHRKFLYCALLLFFWSYINNLNNGLWNYHLLNHMEFSYTLINLVTVIQAVLLIFVMPVWKKILRRYSWIKTFGISMLVFMPTEFIFFCMTKDTSWIYVPNCTYQHLTTAGFTLAGANVLYMNLPEENSTSYITFHNIGVNVCAALGLLTGTWLSSFHGGDTTFPFLGLDIYAVQLTTLARGITIAALGLLLVLKWRAFSSEKEIAEVEERQAAYRRIKADRKKA